MLTASTVRAVDGRRVRRRSRARYSHRLVPRLASPALPRRVSVLTRLEHRPATAGGAGSASGGILGRGHFATGRARFAHAVTTVLLRRSGSPGEATDAPCGASSSARPRGRARDRRGRAWERRAPCSLATVVSSGSGGALLGQEPAAERAAWAGRAPARQRTNERQGGMACARARTRPGAKLGLSSAHLKARAEELGRVDSSIYTSVADADGELILRGSDRRRHARSDAGRRLHT